MTHPFNNNRFLRLQGGLRKTSRSAEAADIKTASSPRMTHSSQSSCPLFPPFSLWEIWDLLRVRKFRRQERKEADENKNSLETLSPGFRSHLWWGPGVGELWLPDDWTQWWRHGPGHHREPGWVHYLASIFLGCVMKSLGTSGFSLSEMGTW